MSTKSWYALRSKTAPTRYGLSKNIQMLLQALDDYHTGSIDAVEMGRLVRLSPKRRTAIADTITKCAGIIKKQPDEIKTCCDIIEMCTEILEVADRPPPAQGFPFMRLPVEIRSRIMALMVEGVFRTPCIVPKTKKSTCVCPNIEFGVAMQSQQMKELPSLLGGTLDEEFFRIFFRKKTVRFTCSCDMLVNLKRNPQLFHHVRRIQVHWCGPESDKAFRVLATCPNLESLTLNISKATLRHLSKRTNLMKTYFPLSYRHVRITEVLGLDELLELKGLKDVTVAHSRTRSPNLTAEIDRANLSELLSNQLKEPKATIGTNG